MGINTNLESDEDFADAEKTVKWCADVEDRLAAAKHMHLVRLPTLTSFSARLMIFRQKHGASVWNWTSWLSRAKGTEVPHCRGCQDWVAHYGAE